MKHTKEQRILFWLGALGLLAIIISTVIQLASTNNVPLTGGDTLTISTNDRIKGSSNAKVTIVEYSDFECPFCQKSSSYMSQLLNDYPDDVRIVYRYFPLTSIHPNAYDAALAAEAANAQGKFWEMHDLLFAKTDEWTKAPNPSTIFQNYAEELSLDKERFRNDMLNKLGKDKIESDLQTADDLKLRGTPSIFANGQPIENSSTYEGLKRQIQTYVEQN